ncbi:DUF3011 domain-containing protein [Stenotrophomonas indicatrix]
MVAHVRRRLIAPVLFCLAAFPLSAAAAVPFFNGSCPGGLDVHADAGGPVYVQGRETSLKRFNDNYYEARDSRSGVTLSISAAADGGVQLSYTGKGGANGVCQVDGPVTGETAQPHHRSHRDDGNLPSEVTCESRDKEQTSCDMDTSGDVRIQSQLSHARCVEGQTWGLSRHSVWVSGGCRAVFRNVSKAGRLSGASSDTLLGACNARKGDQGALVTKVPVGETSSELIIDYPDGRFLCMVTNEGQVLSQSAIRKR